ncbi:cysteine methyltransferase [Arthrobacter sp. NamB2]|uniref:MGMT family protein n=1 Tax=Arthrobacter sp. NamB2 TaxID=2576035 RepID=UPI0010C9EEC5|nr:MGMT family protein [Arthrobacter sp. NamB2]TKV29662.1 cysteine methyltransferase [Arthrobacter sp. NamB2]
MHPRGGPGPEVVPQGTLDPGQGLQRVDPAAYADAVLAVAELIPAGHVLTYGDVAELLQCGGPRQVGRALSRSTRRVPWWRVLRAGGHPPRGLELQARSHYDEEGTALSVPSGPSGPAGDGEYRVDLTRAHWWPSDAEQSFVAELGASLRHAGQEGGSPLRSR